MKRNQEIRKVVEAKFFGGRVHQVRGATNCAVIVHAARNDGEPRSLHVAAPTAARKVRVLKSGIRRISF